MTDEPGDKPTEPKKKKHGGARKGAGRPKGGRPKGSPDSPAVKQKKRRQKILELHAKDLSIAETARAASVSENTVRKVLDEFKHLFPALEKVEGYRQVKTQLLDAAQYKMLEFALKEENLEKATVNNLAYAFSQFNGANRLEQGLSTSNKASTVYVKADFSGASTPTHDLQSRGQEPQAIDVTPETDEDP